MNKQIFSQNNKQVVFALLAIATLGLMTSPVKADDAVIQESIQESVITGNDNVSVQNSNQRNRQVTESRDYRSGYDNYQESNTGIVQRSDQFCDQLGEYNTCVQDAQQSNSTHTRRLRHSR
jgi:hypothetical protein